MDPKLLVSLKTESLKMEMSFSDFVVMLFNEWKKTKGDLNK